MAAFDPATLERWRALAIVDRDGTTVGTISEFYLDRETGHPTWALVETGLWGATQTFVPLVHATEIADGLQVPYEKRHIKDSPRVDLHDELSPDEEATLFAHYGVDYEPLGDPDPATAEGPGPVPVEAVPEEPGTAEGPDPALTEPETTEGPGPVPEEPGTTGNPETAEGPETVSGSPGPEEDPGTTLDHPGSAEALAPTPMGSEGPPTASGEPTSMASDGLTPTGIREPTLGNGAREASGDPASLGNDDPALEASGEPASIGDEDPALVASGEPASIGDEDPAPVASGDPVSMGSEPPASMAREEEPGTVAGEPGTTEGPGQVPPEAGTGGPDDATLIAAGGFGGAPDHPEDSPDPNLSRTAPVEPGLPGSTAASPGPVPTTVDKDGSDPDSPHTEEALRDQDEPPWAPAPAGSFDDPGPADRPAGSSDRWREAKLAAERERIARAAAAQPEERSPLERARRRLERLVGVGQDHPDDDISSADRDEAERARRARLGFDEDDPRLR